MGSPHIIMKDSQDKQITTGSKAIADLLVRRCAEKLINHYPKHVWKVWVSSDHSVINIVCPLVSWYYGYILHITDVQEDPDLKCVMMAGGEILERSRLARERGVSLDDSPKSFDLSGAKRVRLVDKGKSEKVII